MKSNYDVDSLKNTVRQLLQDSGSRYDLDNTEIYYQNDYAENTLYVVCLDGLNDCHFAIDMNNGEVIKYTNIDDETIPLSNKTIHSFLALRQLLPKFNYEFDKLTYKGSSKVDTVTTQFINELLLFFTTNFININKKPIIDSISTINPDEIKYTVIEIDGKTTNYILNTKYYYVKKENTSQRHELVLFNERIMVIALKTVITQLH